jgi:peroxiredoxin (alkyl hydroperoxide reductase subunit C)
MMEDTHASTALPRLNELAPEFHAVSTQGPIKLSDFRGKWVVLFSHPADFTPVCTTEFVAFAQRQAEFDRRNVALLGSSVDSVYSHIAWIRNLEEKFGVKVAFPVVADLDQQVARRYGMVHEPSSVTATVRCVFFIDPRRILRAMIYYPMQVGRNMEEILRVVDALQTVDANQVSCPANWVPGEEVIVPAPATADVASQRVSAPGLHVTDWYFATRQL